VFRKLLKGFYKAVPINVLEGVCKVFTRILKRFLEGVYKVCLEDFRRCLKGFLKVFARC
jgi:hypothetical protein